MKKDEYLSHALVPLLDLLNHEADASNKIQIFTDGVYLEATQSITHETEILIDYGETVYIDYTTESVLT